MNGTTSRDFSRPTYRIYASSDGSVETVGLLSLDRAFTDRTHRVGAHMKTQASRSKVVVTQHLGA